MKKRTPQEWHDEFVEYYKQNYEHDLQNTIQHLGMLIANCNHAYYEGSPIASKMTDADYDDLCKKYVALHKVVGVEIELRSCSFLKVSDFVKE